MDLDLKFDPFLPIPIFTEENALDWINLDMGNNKVTDLGLGTPPVTPVHDDPDVIFDDHSYFQKSEENDSLVTEAPVCEQSDSSNLTEESQSNMSDDDDNQSEGYQPPKIQQRLSRRRRQRHNNRKSIGEISTEETIFSNGKPKLYTVRPFNNPSMERARQNAINAKLNRDKKKQEANKLKNEMEVLRQENNLMKKTLKRFELRASRAEKELAEIKQLLKSSNLLDILKFNSDPEE